MVRNKLIWFRSSSVIMILLLSLMVFAGAGCKDRGTKSPKITSFSPGAGYIGDTVTVTGKNFGKSPSIAFNGTAATITSSTSTEIVATVPAGATSGKITVEKGSLTATSATDFYINVVAFGGYYDKTIPDPESDDPEATITYEQPAYWVGTTATDLPLGDYTDGYGGAQAVSANGTIYVAGNCYNDNSDLYEPVYWTGTTMQKLPVPAGALMGETIDVTVDGQDVYTLGGYVTNENVGYGGYDYYYGGNGIAYYESVYVFHPCYWKGTERVDLDLPMDNWLGAFPTGIAVSDGVVYVSGDYYKVYDWDWNDYGYYYYDYEPYYMPTPVYWAGTTPNDLPLPYPYYAYDYYDGYGGWTSDIAASGGTVYVSGWYDTYDYYYNADETAEVWVGEMPCYWTNTSSEPICLLDDAYFAGLAGTTDQGVVGARTDYATDAYATLEDFWGWTTSIAVSGGSVYIGAMDEKYYYYDDETGGTDGEYNKYSYLYTPSYFKDGVQTTLNTHVNDPENAAMAYTYIEDSGTYSYAYYESYIETLQVVGSTVYSGGDYEYYYTNQGTEEAPDPIPSGWYYMACSWSNATQTDVGTVGADSEIYKNWDYYYY